MSRDKLLVFQKTFIKLLDKRFRKKTRRKSIFLRGLPGTKSINEKKLLFFALYPRDIIEYH
jgi:hypothetical protein